VLLAAAARIETWRRPQAAPDPADGRLQVFDPHQTREVEAVR
jgi:hypothetical protein